jgi:hypothetical protein
MSCLMFDAICKYVFWNLSGKTPDKSILTDAQKLSKINKGNVKSE